MAAKKKFIDPKGDWKKESTGGKVVSVLGYLWVGGIALGFIMTSLNKKV
jgi:hypothetical protein